MLGGHLTGGGIGLLPGLRIGGKDLFSVGPAVSVGIGHPAVLNDSYLHAALGTVSLGDLLHLGLDGLVVLPALAPGGLVLGLLDGGSLGLSGTDRLKSCEGLGQLSPGHSVAQMKLGGHQRVKDPALHRPAKGGDHALRNVVGIPVGGQVPRALGIRPL